MPPVSSPRILFPVHPTGGTPREHPDPDGQGWCYGGSSRTPALGAAVVGLQSSFFPRVRTGDGSPLAPDPVSPGVSGRPAVTETATWGWERWGWERNGL